MCAAGLYTLLLHHMSTKFVLQQPSNVHEVKIMGFSLSAADGEKSKPCMVQFAPKMINVPHIVPDSLSAEKLCLPRFPVQLYWRANEFVISAFMIRDTLSVTVPAQNVPHLQTVTFVSVQLISKQLEGLVHSVEKQINADCRQSTIRTAETFLVDHSSHLCGWEIIRNLKQFPMIV